MKIEVLDLGTRVVDDLTGEETTIIGVEVSVGRTYRAEYAVVVVGYWVDSKYLEGGRHPWEITEKK